MSARGALARARGLYAGLFALCVFVALLPLNTAPNDWPRPDLILALTLAWAMRRPADLSVALIAPLFLAADLLLERPPGLWAALLLIAVETLRGRRRRTRPLPPLTEWLIAALLIGVLALAFWAAQVLFLVRQPPLDSQMARAAVTALIYPAVAAFLHFGLGLRRHTPPDGFGRGIGT
ncbi:MAG: rod shape-determining protein MreD [Qingshengfaniella sp.]